MVTQEVGDKVISLSPDPGDSVRGQRDGREEVMIYITMHLPLCALWLLLARSLASHWAFLKLGMSLVHDSTEAQVWWTPWPPWALAMDSLGYCGTL